MAHMALLLTAAAWAIQLKFECPTRCHVHAQFAGGWLYPCSPLPPPSLHPFNPARALDCSIALLLFLQVAGASARQEDPQMLPSLLVARVVLLPRVRFLWDENM